MSVVNPSLSELESRRAELFEQLAAVGDFRRGSVSENYRRCGKANCACAQPEHPGHGQQWLWTRATAGGKTVGRQAWCLMSMCSRNGVRVPHVVCSRNLGPQGDGFVLGGDDEGLLDPVDVPGQVRRIGLGVELL